MDFDFDFDFLRRRRFLLPMITIEKFRGAVAWRELHHWIFTVRVFPCLPGAPLGDFEVRLELRLDDDLDFDFPVPSLRVDLLFLLPFPLALHWLKIY